MVSVIFTLEIRLGVTGHPSSRTCAAITKNKVALYVLLSKQSPTSNVKESIKHGKEWWVQYALPCVIIRMCVCIWTESFRKDTQTTVNHDCFWVCRLRVWSGRPTVKTFQ